MLATQTCSVGQHGYQQPECNNSWRATGKGSIVCFLPQPHDDGEQEAKSKHQHQLHAIATASSQQPDTPLHLDASQSQQSIP
jgi:hypothetical protein